MYILTYFVGGGVKGSNPGILSFFAYILPILRGEKGGPFASQVGPRKDKNFLAEYPPMQC